LPDPSVLIVATALNMSEAERSLEVLKSIDLPNAVKCVAGPGKVDTRKQAKAFNIESGYPSEPAHLHTLGAWAGTESLTDECFRDGYDLFCLRRLLHDDDAFDFALLVCAPVHLHTDWSCLQAAVSDKLFLKFGAEISGESAGGRPNIAFNLRNDRSADFLDASWELFKTGAAYAIAPYSFEAILCTAQNALGIVNEVRAATDRVDKTVGVSRRRRPFSQRLRAVFYVKQASS
jgi:hypothetical protein